MKILFLHGLESKPGGSKVLYLRSLGYTVLNPLLPRDDFEASVQIAQDEVDLESPDIVVGSSRGGAVAMALNPRGARLILIAPAWKHFGLQPSVPPNTIVIHCATDDIVPFRDSEQIQGAELATCGESHQMSDVGALEAIGRAVGGASQNESFLRRYVRRLLVEADLGVVEGIEYTAFILDASVRDALLEYAPPGWTPKAHHMTLISPPEQKRRLPLHWLDFSDDAGRMSVVAIARNDKVVTGLVDMGGLPIPMNGPAFPHITIAVNPDGGEAVMSNYFELWDFETIESGSIQLKGYIEEVLR